MFWSFHHWVLHSYATMSSRRPWILKPIRDIFDLSYDTRGWVALWVVFFSVKKLIKKFSRLIFSSPWMKTLIVDFLGFSLNLSLFLLSNDMAQHLLHTIAQLWQLERHFVGFNWALSRNTRNFFPCRSVNSSRIEGHRWWCRFCNVFLFRNFFSVIRILSKFQT